MHRLAPRESGRTILKLSYFEEYKKRKIHLSSGKITNKDVTIKMFDTHVFEELVAFLTLAGILLNLLSFPSLKNKGIDENYCKDCRMENQWNWKFYGVNGKS